MDHGPTDHGLSRVRIYSMRFLFLLSGVGLGVPAWSTMFSPGMFDPTEGIAYSFWAAFSALAFLGVRFPVKMLPLLLLQMSYKLIWVIFVGYPLWSAGKMDPVAIELMKASGLGVLFDLAIIPWPYVFKNYIKTFFNFKAGA